MKRLLAGVVIVSSVGLIGCTGTQVGTATGAAAGAGVGYAISGGTPLGTAIGAGAGALVGHSVGQNYDRRNYYHYRYGPYYRY